MTGQTYLKNSTCNDVKLYRHTGIVDAQLLEKIPRKKLDPFLLPSLSLFSLSFFLLYM